MKRLIGVRKSTKVFGRGTLTFIRPANRAVLAYVRDIENEAILCVANISRSAQAVELDLSEWKGRVPQEMLGRTNFPRIGELPYLVTLPPYGFFWFSLKTDAKSEPEKAAARYHNAGARPWLGKRPLGLDQAHFRGRSSANLHARTALVRGQGFADDLHESVRRDTDRA